MLPCFRPISAPGVPARLLCRLAPLLLAACAPVVSHTPRVEPGPALGVVLAARPCDSSCAEREPVPPLGALFRHGWVRDGGTGPGFSVGLFVPGVVVLPLAELDLYVQAPAAPAAPVFGAGLLLAADHVMPYVQAGRVPQAGSGWYTTQGFAVATRPEGRGAAARYWSPAVAYRLRRGDRSAHLFLGGGIGAMRSDDGTGGRGREPLRFVMAGVVVERAAEWLPLLAGRRRHPSFSPP